MKFTEKIKAIWYVTNLFGATTSQKTHYAHGALTSFITLVSLGMSLWSGSWLLACAALMYQWFTAGVTIATKDSVRNLKDEIKESPTDPSRPDASVNSKLTLTSQSLAVIGMWLLKALQLTVAIKLFLMGLASLKSAVKEGRAAQTRASDIGKAIMWFICIPLMFFFEFSTIVEALKAPLMYIGLYDSVTKVVGLRKSDELHEREVRVQEERNHLEREKLHLAKFVAGSNADKSNTEAMRNGNSATNVKVDTLIKINNLLKESTDPVITASTLTVLYRDTYPGDTADEIESRVQKRLKASVYLGTQEQARNNKASSVNNNSPIELTERESAGVTFVSGGTLSDEKQQGEKQGFAEQFAKSLNYLVSMPIVYVFIVLTFWLFVGSLIYTIFRRKENRRHASAVDQLLVQEAAAGSVITVTTDPKAQEWWETYKEDCLLLYGSIPDVLPGSDFSSENGYLLTLATTINTHKTDRLRLGELCNYKSEDQVKQLTQLLAKHRQPVKQPPVKVDEPVIYETRATDTSQDVREAVVTVVVNEPLPTQVAQPSAAVQPAQPLAPANNNLAPQPEAKAKTHACTCGKMFASPKARYSHRKRVGCAVQEAKTVSPTQTQTSAEEVKEGKKEKGSKGQHMKKAAIERDEAPKQKFSKEKRMKAKLNKLEDERNRKYQQWRDLRDSKSWADQDLASHIKEEMDEIKRRAHEYEKGVTESAIAELEGFLKRHEATKLYFEFNKPIAEGLSTGATALDIPNCIIRCTVVTENGTATTGAVPLANRLFLPLHFVKEQCQQIGATVNSKVTVECSNGLPCPSFEVGTLKVVEDFPDQCYVDYQVGGITYYPVDSIGEAKAGDEIVIKRATNFKDTNGEVVRTDGAEAFNVRTSTDRGDCNSPVFSTKTGRFLGVHNTYYPLTRQNAFLRFSLLPKKYLVAKPILSAQAALSEN